MYPSLFSTANTYIWVLFRIPVKLVLPFSILNVYNLVYSSVYSSVYSLVYSSVYSLVYSLVYSSVGKALIANDHRLEASSFSLLVSFISLLVLFFMVCIVIPSTGYGDQWEEHSCRDNRDPEEDLSRESDLCRDIPWPFLIVVPSWNYSVFYKLHPSYKCHSGKLWW